jgi:hypothetical protein
MQYQKDVIITFMSGLASSDFPGAPFLLGYLAALGSSLGFFASFLGG